MKSYSDAFTTSKRDKRHIKHSNLLSKVTKSSAIGSAGARRNKHRRQKRQLVTNLDSLADALPDDGDGADRSTAASAIATLREQANLNVNLIQRKSIKSRPGAMKRREKIDKGERERFARNLVQLARTKNSNADVQGVDGSESKQQTQGSIQQVGHNDRWAALRGFITQTMEPRSDLTVLKT